MGIFHAYQPGFGLMYIYSEANGPLHLLGSIIPRQKEGIFKLAPEIIAAAAAFMNNYMVSSGIITSLPRSICVKTASWFPIVPEEQKCRLLAHHVGRHFPEGSFYGRIVAIDIIPDLRHRHSSSHFVGGPCNRVTP